MNSDEGVHKLVLFYEDACDECKTLFEIVKFIAGDLKGKRILISRINMSRNELEGLSLNKLPLLVIQKSLQDSMSSVYEGEHDIESIKSWIASIVYDYHIIMKA